MKHLGKILAGITIVAGGTLPIIPIDMQLLYSYQGPYAAQFLPPDPQPIDDGSSTPLVLQPVEKRPIFNDDDKNGLISVSVFQDSNGNRAYVQIPDTTYSDMGKKSDPGKGTGVAANPTKEQ